MVRRLSIGKNNHLTCYSLAINPRKILSVADTSTCTSSGLLFRELSVLTLIRDYLDALNEINKIKNNAEMINKKQNANVVYLSISKPHL